MMTELMLVEGVSDIQLISYYLQNVYCWKYEKHNSLGISPLDEYEHIETLSKNGNLLILCGVGGNGKFEHFVEQHRVNEIILQENISTLMVVTDRDEATNFKIEKKITHTLKNLSIEAGCWRKNTLEDSFGQQKQINTYLLIMPPEGKGALERVIIDALYDIPEEQALIKEVVHFIDNLKENFVPELLKVNKSNKATVGTFFSVRNPQYAMRSFSIFISKIEWSKSASLKTLFLPFADLGKENLTYR